MTENSNSAFPMFIDLPKLGRLKRYETRLSYGEICYGYSMEAIKVGGSSFSVSSCGISLSVSAPERGISDVGQFATSIEATWDRILENISRIVNDATPHIDEAIEEFCESCNGPSPSTSRLLAAGELRYVCIFQHYNQHEIGIYDGGLLGGHDLFISLNLDLEPTSAYFDG